MITPEATRGQAQQRATAYPNPLGGEEDVVEVDHATREWQCRTCGAGATPPSLAESHAQAALHAACCGQPHPEEELRAIATAAVPEAVWGDFVALLAEPAVAGKDAAPRRHPAGWKARLARVAVAGLIMAAGVVAGAAVTAVVIALGYVIVVG